LSLFMEGTGKYKRNNIVVLNDLLESKI
jgi:hypothetical protein